MSKIQNSKSKTPHLCGAKLLFVDIKRKTYNRLKDYLLRFWSYYISHPNIRIALESA